MKKDKTEGPRRGKSAQKRPQVIASKISKALRKHAEEELREKRVAISLVAVGAYVLALIPLYRLSGPGMAALATVPVAALAWLWGLRVGLVAGLLSLPLNTLLFNLVGLEGWDPVFRQGGGPGTVMVVLIGAGIGRLRDLGQRLKVEITERKQAEKDLREAHGTLEVRVKERTTELAKANEQLNVELSERKRAEGEIRRLNQELEQRVVERTGELRESEEQLRQTQKMEAVGRLAGGVAHDFNNLLMVMRGYGELMFNRLDANDPLRRNAEEIQKAAERATALTQQLLAFSRKQVLQPKVLDLNAVVTDVEKMLRRLIGEDIKLAAVLDLALGWVKADPGQIEQIILNLAVNARDAMPQGGRLTLKTANVTLDQAYVRQHVGATPGPYVLLAVSDSGVGMDAETQSHIFEPFFTTKGVDKGTGLGLSTVYGIVKQSGGYIWVESAPGRGTTFEIYLPLVEEAVAGEELHPALLAPTPGGAETILVVEDEMSVRRLAAEFLGSSGYTVLEAQDGGAALQVCEEHRGPIHLLITDVVMPGMSGRELAVRLAGRRPEMKVIYMSGYTDDAMVPHGVLEEGIHFLQKPFSLDALARIVREGLEAGRGNNLPQ